VLHTRQTELDDSLSSDGPKWLLGENTLRDPVEGPDINLPEVVKYRWACRSPSYWSMFCQWQSDVLLGYFIGNYLTQIL
jgi:hypothetical protein